MTEQTNLLSLDELEEFQKGTKGAIERLLCDITSCHELEKKRNNVRALLLALDHELTLADVKPPQCLEELGVSLEDALRSLSDNLYMSDRLRNG